MPLYDYECSGCSSGFEEFSRIADRNQTVSCPKCKAKANRVISGGSFMLMGGGWSGTSHPVIIPPQSQPKPEGIDKDGYHTQYMNGCTEKSVYDALH